MGSGLNLNKYDLVLVNYDIANLKKLVTSAKSCLLELLSCMYFQVPQGKRVCFIIKILSVWKYEIPSI